MALSMLLACWKLVDLKNNNNSQQEWEGGQWSGSSRKFYLVYFWCQRPLCVAKAWCQKPPDNAPSPSNTTGWHTPHAQQPGTTMEGYGETNSNWTIDDVKCPLIAINPFGNPRFFGMQKLPHMAANLQTMTVNELIKPRFWLCQEDTLI